MVLKRVMFICGLLAIAGTAAVAQRSIGYTITCLRNNDYCTVRNIPAPAGNMRWYQGVYVEGDGDLGRYRAASTDQCEALCQNNPSCIMAEFYFGRESRPACNLFSRMRRLKWNSSGDALVGVFE